MRVKNLSLALFILILLISCSSKTPTTKEVAILPVWEDENTPAQIPTSCVNIGSSHGSGKNDEEALNQFKLDVLKKGGNAATLLSGMRNINSHTFSVTHAGLAYRCDPEQLVKYQQ